LSGIELIDSNLFVGIYSQIVFITQCNFPSCTHFGR